MNAIVTLMILVALSASTEAISCRYGRAACIGSCMAQNCASGYCTSVPDGTCVCVRCGTGPPW